MGKNDKIAGDVLGVQCWKLYFHCCTVNVNEIITVMCFSKVTCQFLLVYCKVCMSKISDIIDKFC